MKKIVLRGKMAVRLPHWTNCVVEIMDVGTFSMWGRLVDIKTNEVIIHEGVFPLDDDWRVALDVQSVLNNF